VGAKGLRVLDQLHDDVRDSVGGDPETVAGLWVTKYWGGIDYNVYRIGLKDLRGTLVNSWPTLDGTGRTGGDADWNDAFETVGLTQIHKSHWGGA
jgi:hypothetical protein